jgi:hypothetical protein
MPQQTLRFYLSSTFRDLEEERASIAKYLVRMEQLPIETKIASAGQVLGECLADVESCDAMILLVASSYGTIVANQEGVERSVTHHEFLHAKSLDIPVLVFDLTYKPSEDLTPAQLDGLRRLRNEIGNLERIPAYVASKDDLLGEVLTAVGRHMRQSQFMAFSATAEPEFFFVPSHTQSARPSPPVLEKVESAVMYLQVQLKRCGDRFDLIPEIFLPPSGNERWRSCSAADPQPCEGVPTAELADVLAELCEQAQSHPQIPSLAGIKQVVMELLLPTEIIAELFAFSADQLPSAAQLRQAFKDLSSKDYPYLLRSLDRAANCKAAPVKLNRLLDHWQHAQGQQPRLLACSRWPALGSEADPADHIRPFQCALQELDAAVSALVALLPCPADLLQAGTLLQAMLASPLPLLLLWHSDATDPSDATAPRSRWANAGELLDRQLPDLPDEAFRATPGDAHQLYDRHLMPKAWCSHAAARRRRTLLGDKQRWVDQAVLVLDSPERWPVRINPNRPKVSGRYQLRRTPSS